MANYFEPSDQMRADWAAWVRERPDFVRDAIDQHKFATWILYRMKSTGQRVTLKSFDEWKVKDGGACVDGHEHKAVTARVIVSGHFNFVTFEREVFGVDLDDLEECDLPTEGELLGSMGMSIEEARRLVNGGRPS